MSLHMAPNMARLTVLGCGWSNTAQESGDGFTVEGDLLEDIADELDYDFGDDVDWDLIADDAGIDWSDIIYTDPDGIIYTDPDGDGIWTDPLTGQEYPGGGSMWLPDNMLIDMADYLERLADEDAKLTRYSIPNDAIPSLFGGPVSGEVEQAYFDSARPHYYSPPTYYIKTGSRNGTIFLGEPFFHGTASGGSITVYDEAITIRDGSSKAIYYSDCSTIFPGAVLPAPYSSYPIQYVCWQCIYGSLSDALISKTDDTITADDIIDGTSGLPSMSYGGGRYYRVNAIK